MKKGTAFTVLFSAMIIFVSIAFAEDTWDVNDELIDNEEIEAVCNDQDPGDLYIPGRPVNATKSENYDHCDTKPWFTRVNSTNFYIYKKLMHKRWVTVAFQRGYPITHQGRMDFSKFVFDTWAIFWREFNGFPYDSYTVAIGSNFKTCSAFGRGHDYPIIRTSHVAHEIYHAWNGNAFPQDDRVWFSEGVTTYYDVRQQDESPFNARIREHYEIYLSYRKQGKDRAIGNMSQGDPDYDHQFAASKGAVVAYLLDMELNKTGHHIGQVARLLYQRYGVRDSRPISNEVILSAFNEVSGTDFTIVFNRYLYSIERLLLNNPIVRVCHD